MESILDSVKKLEDLLKQSGCEDGGVRLDVDPDVHNCQFEHGESMIASFGGRSAIFVTSDPIRACTRISFMFGAPLDLPATRSAAAAIMNVITGFFCLSRVLHPCTISAHSACINQLLAKLSGHSVFCLGIIPQIDRASSIRMVCQPQDADVILIGAEGLIVPEAGDTVSQYGSVKRMLCLGPSTAGVARFQNIDHWCPFGTICRDSDT